MSGVWRRFVAWWSKPIKVEVTVRKSPDWDGDAARYRDERGWGDKP